MYVIDRNAKEIGQDETIQKMLGLDLGTKKDLLLYRVLVLIGGNFFPLDAPALLAAIIRRFKKNSRTLPFGKRFALTFCSKSAFAFCSLSCSNLERKSSCNISNFDSFVLSCSVRLIVAYVSVKFASWK